MCMFRAGSLDNAQKGNLTAHGMRILNAQGEESWFPMPEKRKAEAGIR